MATVAELLSLLWRTGPALPATLRAELRVSARSLNRLVEAAGEQVHAIGRARAIRYARTRSVEGAGRSVPAFRVGEDGSVSPDGVLWFLMGGETSWEKEGVSELFVGLPPELADMAPQGFLGRAFPGRHPELRLPESISDWSDDHRLLALTTRGEDCVGNLVIGDESLRRLVARSPVEVEPADYPRLAASAAGETVGSSAGGERPKFGAFSGGRHVLVKYAPPGDSAAERRWRDLAWCEWKALETVAAAGRPASRARCLDVDGWRFLEVERFDRVGARGRRGVLSLAAINNEYLGTPASWTDAAGLLVRDPFRLSREDAASVRWLDVFGQLAGNTDRHFGNLSFLAARDGALRLAPAYDMLPMVLAPSGDIVAARRFDPAPPRGDTLEVWPDAARWAGSYWSAVVGNDDLSSDLRAFADVARGAVAEMSARVGGR